MAFEDVAKRMKDRGRGTRSTFETIWHGEELPPEPLPSPNKTGGRTKALLGAYAVLLLGLLIAAAAALFVLFKYTSLSRWERRGMIFIGCAGAALVVKATMMFDAIPDD